MSDRLMLNPTEKQLAAALRRTAGVVNRANPNGRKFERTPVGWQRWARACLREPAGRQSMTTTGSYVRLELVLAWWSDPFGRKHVRVSGRTPYRYLTGLRTQAALKRLPPLWHVYQNAFLRYRQAETKTPPLLVACRCGAVGSPQSLAWTGECCGPCHDRRQEGGTPAGGFGPVRGLQPRPGTLAFTPDGTALFAQDASSRATLTELRTGNRRIATVPGGYRSDFLSVAFTADGTAAVLGCYGGRVLHWRLSESNAAVITEKAAAAGSVLSPDGLQLAHTYGNRVRTYDLSATPTTSRSYPCEASALTGRFTADGRLLVFHVDGSVWEYPEGARAGELVRGDCLRGWRKVQSEYRGVGFAADGSAVAVSERTETAGRTIRVLPLPDGKAVDFPIPKWHDPAALVFSPCKSVLASGGKDGWVGLWDLPAGKNPVWVQPVPENPVESVSALAFSPTGDTLAVGFPSWGEAPSVYLIPWRALRGRPAAEA
ncbi:MAG TPA: WD40 repeat domain-containing protein [Gemmataceae bacterium]|nr:WD40 repeat domain-containing protein [Gemmataceae bacterium]